LLKNTIYLYYNQNKLNRTDDLKFPTILVYFLPI